VGFSIGILRIRSRTSFGTRGLPGFLLFHLQQRRKPFRCQPTTVSGPDEDKRTSPLRPQAGEEGPETPVERSEPRFLSGSLQNLKLVAQGEVLEDQRRSRPERG
jgi:hypothetical protein